MYLWNDYEGKTLRTSAGEFALQRLLRTEGRSGFFLTSGRGGEPLVIRLTESLNDDERMLGRYRTIEQLGEPNLLAIRGFGTAEFDSTPLFFLLLEPAAESLADILKDRALAVDETDEVAGVVLAGLRALHGAGLVHGLVEPECVLAAGDNIKLRSDCAHPAPEPPEDAGARAADVRGFADLLHRSLTRAPLVDESDALALPEPYASVVRQVLRGNWGLGEIEAELRRTHHMRGPVVVPPAVAAAPLPAVAAAPVSLPVEPPTPLVAAAPRTVVAEVPAPAAGAQLPLVYEAPEPQAEAPLPPRRMTAFDDDEPAAPGRKPWLPIAIGIAAVLLIWALVHSWGSHSTPAPKTAAATPAPVVAPAPSGGPAPAITASPAPAPRAAAAPSAAPVTASAVPEHTRGSAVWRVVAYTYHRADEAASKARSIAAHHHDLHPEVFSPSGHAPYLVTLGAGMSHEEAEALRSRARHDGLARDVYIQNYTH